MRLRRQLVEKDLPGVSVRGLGVELEQSLHVFDDLRLNTEATTLNPLY